jgi:hypothetical protein
MSNCGPTRQLTRRPLYVNMDPLFIPGSLSKLIDALLCYFDPIADPNFSPDSGLDFFEILEHPHGTTCKLRSDQGRCQQSAEVAT